ncbi:MAG: hypothetical protein IJS99_02885 [Synergistaceae bacterium]|nr:hypothetical protein [Synergistaceae bacterium]
MNVVTGTKNIKLEILRHRLLNYYEAEQAILTGQEFELEGLRLTRADLKVVRDTINDLEHEITNYESAINPNKTRPRFRVVIPKERLY